MLKLRPGLEFTNTDGVSYTLVSPGPGDRWKVRIKSLAYSGLIYLPTQELIKKRALAASGWMNG